MVHSVEGGECPIEDLPSGILFLDIISPAGQTMREPSTCIPFPTDSRIQRKRKRKNNGI